MTREEGKVERERDAVARDIHGNDILVWACFDNKLSGILES